MTRPTRDQVRLTARGHLRSGIRAEEAIVLAFARLCGEPLDLDQPDDAAVVLRSGRLVLEQVDVAEALKVARTELRSPLPTQGEGEVMSNA